MPKTKNKQVALVIETDALIDGAFTVDRAKWGTFRSYDAEGKALVTSPTEESCIDATRCYLKWRQEGFTNEATSYDGEVGGKL
jgi:RecB family exonuclease